MHEEKLEKVEETAGTAGDKSLEELLAEAQAKVDQQRDAMIRAIAETENVRKRLQTEAATSQKYALERFADGLLPVVDSLEAAVAAKDTSGVELTLKQLLGALDKGHIRPVDPQPGERFDPNRHQAMAAVPSTQDPNTVISVLQKGYVLHDRILRPALVTVAKALEKAGGTPNSESEPN